MYFILFLSMMFLSLVVSRSDTKSDLKSQAEREISQLFLQKLPVPGASKHVCNKTVPSFLKKLYRMQNRLSTFSQVLCMFSEDLQPSRKRLSFFFDLSDIENFSEANKLQLHVFKRRSKLRNSRQFYYIHLYLIFESNINNASHGNERLISSRFVGNSRGEWLSFDLTSEVNSQENALTTTKLSFLLEVKAVEHRSIKSKPVSIAKSGRKQPFILVFFQTLHNPLPTSKVQKQAELSLNQFPFAIGRSRFPRASTYSGKPSELCSRRESLYINFQELGFTTIIAPRGYEAFYCDGACPIFSGDSNPYSFLRSRQRLVLSGKNIPAACCVPTQFKSLMIMFYNEKGIVVRSIQGMLVSSCGCK